MTSRSNATTVSVVIPTRNRLHLLRRAVDSLVAQTYRPIEVVIVDDASADPIGIDGLEITQIEGFELSVHRRDAPRGPGPARNHGIQAASGTFLTFLDDDDTLAPEAIATAVAWLEQHPGAPVCSAWHSIVFDGGGGEHVYRGPRRCSLRLLCWYDAIATLFPVVRTAAVGDELHFDESLPSCEDWDLWLRLASRQPITVLPVPLYRYHQHRSARVAGSGATTHTEGRQRLLAKHRRTMSAACVSFHEAHIALLSGESRSNVARLLLSAGSPSALLLFATEVASARLGLRLSDPGLPARVLGAILDGRARVTGE